MIDFKIDGGNLERVILGGEPDDIVAELCIEISLVYGGLLTSVGKKEAEEFKDKLLFSLMIGEPKERIFSGKITNAVNGLKEAQDALIGIDGEEFLRQLREIMNESQ